MKSLISNINEIIKKSIKLQIAGLFFTIIYTVTIILSPIASKYLIDNVLTAKELSDIKIGIIIFFMACVSQSIAGFFKDIIFLNSSLNINMDISEKMFNKIINANFSFFDKSKNGEIVSRITNDGKILGQFLTNFFIIFIKNILLVIIIIISMLLISVKITSIVVILFILFFLLNSIVGKKFDAMSNEIASNNDSIHSYINQVINSITMIKAFSIENTANFKYKSILNKIKKDSKKKEMLGIILKNLSNAIVMVCLSLIYGLGTLEIIKGKMTLGSVVGLGLYFQLLIQPIYDLINNSIDINSIRPIVNRVNEYLNIDQEMLDYSQNKDFKIDELKVENLCFSYNGKEEILKNINIKFPKIGIVGIAGDSGCGKSTFIKLLLNFYEPTKGVIKVNSNNYCDIGISNIRKNIALVPQEINLFNLSIKENFKEIDKNISLEYIISICKMVNLHKKINEFENKYDTIINERVNLSGGEKQRLGIALALAKNSSILILDEPTSALDSFNENKLLDILKKLSGEKLIIIISHKKSTLKICDEIHYLNRSNSIIQLDKGENYI